jgi:ankyrin repeat protein
MYGGEPCLERRVVKHNGANKAYYTLMDGNNKVKDVNDKSIKFWERDLSKYLKYKVCGATPEATKDEESSPQRNEEQTLRVEQSPRKEYRMQDALNQLNLDYIANQELNELNKKINGRTPLTFAINKIKVELSPEDKKKLLKSKSETSYEEKQKILEGIIPVTSREDKNKIHGIINFLIEKGVYLNEVDDLNRTALMYAIEKGLTDVAKLLIDKGVDLSLKSLDKETALMFAIKNGKGDIVMKLLSLISRKAYSSSFNGSDTVETFRNLNINAQNKDGNTALMLLALNAKLFDNANAKIIVEMLINQDADINLKNNKKQTAYDIAIENKNYEVAGLLIGRYSNLNKKDPESGKTALMYAIENGSKDFVKLLIEKKANLNEKDNSGKTALMYAIEAGSKNQEIGSDDIGKLLIEKGANLNEQHTDPNSGKTALIYAIEQDTPYSIYIAKIMIEKMMTGTDKDKREQILKTARDQAGVMGWIAKDGHDVLNFNKNNRSDHWFNKYNQSLPQSPYNYERSI